MRLRAGAELVRRIRRAGRSPNAPSVRPHGRAAVRRPEGAFWRKPLLLAALALAACSGQPPLPARPIAAGPQITVHTTALPLNPDQPTQERIGAFAYAGGLLLTSPDTARLHGLSDVFVRPDGALVAVSDDGDLFEARLALDAKGRLVGVSDGRLSPLAGEDGQPLSSRGKVEADAEGLAVLRDGARLVSFERDHRTLLYPADGGPPRKAPQPKADFPDNEGMEALAADPARGPDAYLVGGEASGQTWACRLAAGCAESALVDLPDEFSLVALVPLPHGGRAYLFRAFSMLKGVRITLRIVDAHGATVDELKLAAPLSVDNLEGLAALPQADGSIRFYLLADDNFSKLQRTLLLAFDWRPKTGRNP